MWTAAPSIPWAMLARADGNYSPPTPEGYAMPITVVLDFQTMSVGPLLAPCICQVLMYWGFGFARSILILLSAISHCHLIVTHCEHSKKKGGKGKKKEKERTSQSCIIG